LIVAVVILGMIATFGKAEAATANKIMYATADKQLKKEPTVKAGKGLLQDIEARLLQSNFSW